MKITPTPFAFSERIAICPREAEEPGHRLAAEKDVRAHVAVVGEREAAEYSGETMRVIIGAARVISAVCAGLDGLLS